MSASLGPVRRGNLPASIADQRQYDLDKTKAGAQQQNVNQTNEGKGKQ